jgi:hypothetical protein
VQSVCDNTRTSNQSTRTQTQKWSASNNPMAFTPGNYVFYYSFRLQELPNGESPFPHRIARGGGGTKYSQLLQFKSFGDQDSTIPLTSRVGSDGIQFHIKGGSIDEYAIVNLPTGVWIRLALVANWDSNGWMEAWADTDQNGSMTRVVDRVHGIDFMEGNDRSAPGIGLYHHMDLFDGSVSGQPRQDTVYTDYANVQITAYNGS